MKNENMDLIIDNEDTYGDFDDVYYVNYSRIGYLKYLSQNRFNSANVKNCPVDYLTPFNMIQIYATLKVGATLEVTVSEPLDVMKIYDAKQIEANAKLAGFENIFINEATYVDDKTQEKEETYRVTCTKPGKKEFTSEDIKGIKEDVRTRTLTRKRTRTGIKKNKRLSTYTRNNTEEKNEQK
jgi:hypothetical protein